MLIQCPKNSILPSSLSHLKNVLTQLNNHSQSQPPLLHSLPATSTPPLHRNILQVIENGTSKDWVGNWERGL
ncbi:hypothetical protein ES319_A10G185100v1 [Gossypium barbadense]|uniref:Uncharacterized protein n=2 Tax=Gossypium TaxID=3633 RepID=A0A5J5U5G9_GOSBA|nr:hypothetical protein ES319_A10G185100v1 [Gossypium barbadense]TYG99592.1 hypothetical protein ES288_A10G207000v1 [Gossypium darwinii]